jgi:Protein of unknown function (DUF1838)
MSRLVARRALLQAAVAAPIAATATRTASAARARHGRLDLAKPADAVVAYLKMRASSETQDVYMWFAGRLDLAVPGEPVRPIVNVESLILRRTERVSELAWNVIDWEASYYRDIETGAIVTGSITNPVTGEAVKPLPYVEGPVRFRFTDQEPRIVGSRDVMPKTGKPFNYPWRVVAGDLTFTKSNYIEVPNWLQPEQFPRESAGPKLVVATHSTLRSSAADVMNPRVASARVDFAYTATSGWLPWMMMGQRPGHVIWAEAGKKLFSLDEAPPEQVAALRQLHPQWFGRPEPWPEFTNMYLRYKAMQNPG